MFRMKKGLIVRESACYKNQAVSPTHQKASQDGSQQGKF